MKKHVLSFLVLSILFGCSTKKDNFKNRNYHKMTSWFNGLFNAQEELDKKRNEAKLSYIEDFSEILPLNEDYYIDKEKLDIKDDIPGIGASFMGSNSSNEKEETFVKPSGYDAVEGKSNKVIEKHSMAIQGVERNPMIGKAYLLIGKSKFHQGKYFEALEALNFINTNLPNSKYKDEASFYITLSDINGGNYFDGQEKLIKLYEKNDLNKELTYLVAANYADFLIKNQNYEEAIDPLKRAISYARNNDEKARTLFALGQIYSKLGMQNEAGEIFTAVYKSKPGFNMEVKSLLAIAANFDPKTNNYTNYKNYLLDQSKKGIYISKKNEFYYAIAEMAFKNGNLKDAEEYSKLSLKEEISDPYIRGKAYENFANLKFSKGNYLHSKSYYDSAVSAFPKEADKNRLKTKSDLLNKVTELHYLVEKNDSILNLAKMSNEDQKIYFSTYIENLKKAEEKQLKEDAKNSTNFQLAEKSKGFNNSFDDNKSSKFYFYNQSLKNNGKTEFQRIWNISNLKDNWRTEKLHGGKSTIEDLETELKGQLASGDPRRFEIDYYIEKIPTSNEELTALKITRDTAQLALGTGYFDYFNDVDLASKTLDKLITAKPLQKETEIQAVYQLYRIYKNRDQGLEEKYKNIILSQYGDTIYAGYILNPSTELTSSGSKEAIAEYETVYELFKEGKYNDVKTKSVQAIAKYPTEIIIAKFALLNALAISKTESHDQFEDALEKIISTYDGTDEAKHVKELLNKVKKPKEDKTKNSNETNSTFETE